jgi:hypothetical protein
MLSFDISASTVAFKVKDSPFRSLERQRDSIKRPLRKSTHNARLQMRQIFDL